jgi:acyl-CoA thioesterase FadM
MRISLQTRYSDYGSKGHVNNGVYLTYFELGRIHAWAELEVTTSEVRNKAWVCV